MSLITTRSGKGASLTHSELDGNFPKAAQTKAANYTVAVGDNRDTIEVTATANISLPDAAGIVAASDTGDFEVTIKNISGITTISRVTAGDTIDGVASDITIQNNDTVTLKVNQAGDGYNITAGAINRGVQENINANATSGFGVALIADINHVTASVSNAVLTLPSSSIGMESLVLNETANNIIILPNVGAGGSFWNGAGAFPLAAYTNANFLCIASNTWTDD